MLYTEELERRIERLANHEHDGSAKEAWLSRVDNILPQQSISINQFAATKRKMVNQGGEPFPYNPELTPYAVGINDACDHPDVRVIAVKGNTRSAKTVSAENMVLRDWTYGRSKNVLWFMQDEDSLNDYIDERGEEMLRIHPEVDEKIDWTDPKNGRKRKKIGKSLVLYRPATQRALRAKAAPTIVADEIDAYTKKVRDAIMTLVTSRQEEFGTAAKAYICSHPDAGPDGGIDQVLKDSLLHIWFVRCPHCGKASSPAVEAEAQNKARMRWNVNEMMPLADEMDRVDFLDHVAANVRLVCPHDGCDATFGPAERLDLMAAGRWLQPHQEWLDDGTIKGEPRVSATMGFVIHAFMAPFVKLPETARDWAAAKLTLDATGIDTHFREVVVKKLGETPIGASEEERVEGWKTVQARISSHYPIKTVPAGVMFLTAFVDVQGDRFEVRVIGWDLGKQSWLIDAYALKQWPAFGKHSAFDNIDPGNRLTDWDIITEAVIKASYPLQSNPQRLEAGLPELFLPIAKTVINSAGQPGVTNNARTWAANGMATKEFQTYQILLMQGSARKTGETYGKPKQVEFDDMAKPLATPVFERYPNVHEIKRLIARRMKIDEPGPGRMHMPSAISPRYYQELTAERLVNGDWVQSARRNETWDGWVACEVAREALKPDRPDLWSGSLPVWADLKPRGQGRETMLDAPMSVFDRLAKLNAET
jgi:phage terminase large subunit GpA-like protein